MRSVLPFFGNDGEENCQEFAHIHHYSIEGFPEHQMKLMVGESFFQQATESCHEGKLVVDGSPFPAACLDFENPSYGLRSALIFELKNHFKSPTLEPHRKPPKFS